MSLSKSANVALALDSTPHLYIFSALFFIWCLDFKTLPSLLLQRVFARPNSSDLKTILRLHLAVFYVSVWECVMRVTL